MGSKTLFNTVFLDIATSCLFFAVYIDARQFFGFGYCE